MEGKTLTLFILSPHSPPPPPLSMHPPSFQLLLPPSLSEAVEDSFNAPDNLCGWLRTMEIK